MGLHEYDIYADRAVPFDGKSREAVVAAAWVNKEQAERVRNPEIVRYDFGKREFYPVDPANSEAVKLAAEWNATEGGSLERL